MKARVGDTGQEAHMLRSSCGSCGLGCCNSLPYYPIIAFCPISGFGNAGRRSLY